MRQIFRNENIPDILPVDVHLPAVLAVITDRRAISSRSTRTSHLVYLDPISAPDDLAQPRCRPRSEHPLKSATGEAAELGSVEAHEPDALAAHFDCVAVDT